MRFFFFSFLCFSVFYGISQNTNDAFRFGQQGMGGTARYMAMSGSMGALGGDVSAIAVNPGGLGIFRRGQATMSISTNSIATESTHYGNSNSENGGRGRMSNLSLVLCSPFDYSNWKYGSVVFGYRNKAQFDNNIIASGINQESSQLDQYFSDIINEPNLYLEDIPAYFPFGAGLAWGAFLIDTAAGQYYHTNPFYGENQSKITNTSGGMGEYYAGFGANYLDKLYVGGTVGFTSLKYTSKSNYKEELESSSPYGLKSWTQFEELNIGGSGVHLKLGFIYWLKETIRVGLAFNSRERFRLTDKYFTSVNASWGNRENTYGESPDGYNEYTFRSPYRIIGSLGLVRIRRASLNTDIEYVDYRSMNYATSPEFGTDFTLINDAIKQTFQPALNLRVGGELLYGPFIFRAGAAHWGNPYKDGNNGTKNQVTTGIGWRKKHFFIDAAYGYNWTSDWNSFIHYAKDIKLQATSRRAYFNQISVTFGIKFQEEN